MAALLGGGGIGALLTKRWEHSRRLDVQEHRHYLELFASLQKRIDALEAAHHQCQEENGKLREEVGALREAVARLEGRRPSESSHATNMGHV